MPTVYPSLAIGAMRRLALFKREAAQPNLARPLTWRDVRFATLKSSSGLSQGFNIEHGRTIPIWSAHLGAQFERERFADECEGGPDHRGWFCDDRQEQGTARGIVARLPHGRFIAGYYWSDNGERVYFPTIYSEERKAARASDSHAEYFADMAREDNAKYEEARELELDNETDFERLRECLALARINFNRDGMREEARDLIGNIRDRRERLKTEFANYI